MRLCVLLALAAVVAFPSAPAAQPPVDQPPAAAQAEKDRVKMDPETKAAVDKALKWLSWQQSKEGNWGNTAITSFCLLAFMANGHLPNQGEYSATVTKGLRYLMASDRGNGYLIGDSGGNMYCHGMATLALTQAYGMTGDPKLKEVTKRAIKLIENAQQRRPGRSLDFGGWHYDPNPAAADISVTIMQVMALRGAKDSGLQVSDETMNNAIEYIGKCRDRNSGGYKYQPYSAVPGYARTAAGVCVLQLCGKYDAQEIKKAVEYLDRVGDDRQHYWYGHYYAAHALNQVGGKVWEEYYDRMRDNLVRGRGSPEFRLLDRDHRTGTKLPDDVRYWKSNKEAGYGPEYQTSIAILILSTPTHYLPIYQK
jgi:hypothetical protein